MASMTQVCSKRMPDRADSFISIFRSSYPAPCCAGWQPASRLLRRERQPADRLPQGDYASYQVVPPSKDSVE